MMRRLSTSAVETPHDVAARIQRALKYVPADRIAVAPDCGLKYSRARRPFKKLVAMVEGARLARQRL
jgi:5-methyltetrahydropteroyltriglutamate--homocysteine methyltransferase